MSTFREFERSLAELKGLVALAGHMATAERDALTRMLAHRATQAAQAHPPYRPVPETRREIIRILRHAQRDIEATAMNERIDADIREWLLARSKHYKAEIAAALGIQPSPHREM
jgi:hypothetical protein